MAIASYYSGEKKYGDFGLEVGLFLISQDPLTNTSVFRWEVYMRRYSSINKGIKSYTVKIDCTKHQSLQTTTTTVEGEFNLNFEVDSSTSPVERMIDSGEFTAEHGTNGGLTVNVQWNVAYNDYTEEGFLRDWLSAFVYVTDIPKIPRETVKLLTASNFTDEENPSITYTNPTGSDATKIEACISITGGQDDVPYREISLTDSSYTFNLTDAERNTLRAAAASTQALQVRFYLRVTWSTGERYFIYLTRTFTITDCNPVISNISLRDVNSTTSALTGDDSIFIKYASMVEYSYTATATKQATIVSQYVQNGGQKITGLSQGVIDDPESGSFIFSVTDSRGLTTTQTVERTILDYVKPTCYQNIETEIVGETGAIVHLTISGNYFNGTFGAIPNTIKIELRYTQNDGTMGDWVDLTNSINPTFNGNTYKLEVDISGFDYSQAYEFQSRMTDKLNTVVSATYTVKILPVFDWSGEDFNFNVPVSMNEEVILRHTGSSTNNTVLSASGGHIYVRPGGTTDTSSETIFYPDGDVSFKGSIIINNGTTFYSDGSADFKGPITINNQPLTSFPDYIVETGEEAMGTNGTWYWEKWDSGKAVCYGKRNFGRMAITTQKVDDVYRSATLTQNLPSGLFNDAPIFMDISTSPNGENTYRYCWIGTDGTTAASATSTGGFCIMSCLSTTAAASHISFHIIGRWKQEI